MDVGPAAVLRLPPPLHGLFMQKGLKSVKKLKNQSERMTEDRKNEVYPRIPFNPKLDLLVCVCVRERACVLSRINILQARPKMLS